MKHVLISLAVFNKIRECSLALPTLCTHEHTSNSSDQGYSKYEVHDHGEQH